MSGDKGDPEDEYPFVCYHQVPTGHWDNIFSAKMLPFSTRLCVQSSIYSHLCFALEPQVDEWARFYRATAARDGLVRVFDVGAEISTYDSASPHSRESPTRSGWKQRTIRCHSNSVKRITTELSPDVFLTVSEVSITVRRNVTARAERTKQDGAVRQHDLRAPTHRCGGEGAACPTPLVKVSHRLFSMSIAPSAPHQLVVAGDHPYVCFILLPKMLSQAHPMHRVTSLTAGRSVGSYKRSGAFPWRIIVSPLVSDDFQPR